MNEPRRTDLAGPAAPSDAAIIERSVAVPECFAEIFDRHAEGIYRYAARRLGQQAAAEVVSEVFLAAFRNRRRYDTGRDDARPWLYGIAVNVISQYQRDQRRYARVLAAVPYVPATDVVADEVIDRVTAAQLRPRIVRVLGELSDSDRELVLLVAWAELSYEQTAQALGIPLGTVRSRLRAHGTLDELIFDPKTYLYIGDSQIALNSTYMPKGTVNGNAVQQIAVVDKPGQLP